VLLAAAAMIASLCEEADVKRITEAANENYEKAAHHQTRSFVFAALNSTLRAHGQNEATAAHFMKRWSNSVFDEPSSSKSNPDHD
jgi:hypothetical protein